MIESSKRRFFLAFFVDMMSSIEVAEEEEEEEEKEEPEPEEERWEWTMKRSR